MSVRFPLFGLLVVAACAPAPEAAPLAPQSAVYTATDFAFTGPDTLTPGMTTIQLVNSGSQSHHMIMARLDEGKTTEDLVAFFQANQGGGDPAWASWRGASGGLAPGGNSVTTTGLQAGTYVLICFVPDPADGTPHFFKGMTKTVVVTGEPNMAAAPVTDLEIHLKDFAFDAPELTAGAHIIRVINDGPQVHELQLLRLNDGVTGEQFLAAMAANPTGPPMGTDAGGAGALSVGLANYWHVTLAPGNYLFLCFVPDPADGAPHIMKGMSKAFTIPAA